jgi:hypothetical protein
VGLAIEDAGIFYGNLVYIFYGYLVYFVAWISCNMKNQATLDILMKTVT